jgi:hypothetical protein
MTSEHWALAGAAVAASETPNAIVKIKKQNLCRFM